MNKPGRVTKGVRKLRTKEAGAGVGGLGKSESTLGVDARSVEGYNIDGGRDADADVRSTHTAQSGHSYPPPAVLDPNMRTGAAEWERTLWKKLEVGDLVLLRDDEQVGFCFFTLCPHLPSIFAFVIFYGTNAKHAHRSPQTSSSSPRPTRTGTATSRRRISMGRRI
jgi:hypothetical protein